MSSASKWQLSAHGGRYTHKLTWAKLYSSPIKFMQAVGLARPRTHKSAGLTAYQSPLCPDSDQILQRSETTLWAMRRHRAASFDRFVSIPNPNAISDRNRLRNRVSGTYLNEEILGLLEVRRAITSFAIVTTDAAPSVAQYHNRMPVVLEDSQFDEWMRGTTDQAAALMKPYAGAIEAWEVGADVGNVKNNRPELMDRVGLL